MNLNIFKVTHKVLAEQVNDDMEGKTQEGQVKIWKPKEYVCPTLSDQNAP